MRADFPAPVLPHRIRQQYPESVIESLLRFSLQAPEVSRLPAELGTAGVPIPGTLFTTLTAAEAFKLATVAHPTLRPRRPEGGVLRECLRRHGLVPAWGDLPSALPDLVFDADEAERVRNAERAVLTELKAEHARSTYRVPARRCRPGTVVWDAARVPAPAVALSRLLKARVEIAAPSDATPADFADP